MLFPATKHDPSEAMVTERIGTSPAGAWARVRKNKSMEPGRNAGKTVGWNSLNPIDRRFLRGPTVLCYLPDHRKLIPLGSDECTRR